MGGQPPFIPMEPEIKVTKIKNRWHSRLIENAEVLDEMACSEKQDIGWISREMLRWYDKNGGVSDFTSSARKRQVNDPVGKIWYKKEL